MKTKMLQHMPDLYRFAYTLCKNPHFSEDLVQETMLKALLNIDKFQEGTNLRGWLFVILKNSFRNQIRANKYRIMIPIEDISQDFLRNSPNQSIQIEVKDALKLVKKMNPEQQNAILYAMYGYSYEEIAEAEKIPIGTVKSRLSRARHALKNSSC